MYFLKLDLYKKLISIQESKKVNPFFIIKQKGF